VPVVLLPRYGAPSLDDGRRPLRAAAVLLMMLPAHGAILGDDCHPPTVLHCAAAAALLLVLLLVLCVFRLFEVTCLSQVAVCLMALCREQVALPSVTRVG